MTRMSPMKMRFALVVFSALPGMGMAQGSAHAPLPAQSETPGWNWADDGSRISRSPQFAASKAICQRLRAQEPRAADWPAPATAATLADCDSAALYYGIGVTADPVRARQCALLETQRAGGNGGPFSGTAMLMTIYANGVGDERNLDLATSLACRIDGAAFEVDGRVKHLQKLEAEDWNGHDFSYCDDITSGMAAGLCAEHQTSIASAARSDKLDNLTRSWTAAERMRFEQLLGTMRTYAQASSENEVDLSGTARAAFMLEREQDVKDQLVKLLDTLQAGGLPVAAAADGQSADAQLNQVYRQIMAIKPDADGRIGAGTVKQSGIRTAQRAWLPYRDAWIAFVAVKYPQVSASSVQAALTRQRIKDLQDFVPRPQAARTASARPGRAIAVTFHPLPATAAGVLAAAQGIVTGGNADATPVLQVIFDPNAPSDAALWRNLQRLHPDLVVRWLPVDYFGKDSAVLAATLLDAPDPAAALAENFGQYDRRARHGGVQPTPGKTLGAAQAALRAAWVRYGGYTPMIVVVDTDGNGQRTGGANPEVIDAALRMARPQTPLKPPTCHDERGSLLQVSGRHGRPRVVPSRTMSHRVDKIRFKTKLLRPATPKGASWAFLRLPPEASEKLPTRSMVTVDGVLGDHPFQATLQPDGQGGHWLKVDKALQEAAGVAVGDTLALAIAPVEVEPEPKVPADLRKALSAHPAARATWDDITPVARRDWIHWITSGKKAETRERRIATACDQLASGKRRACCFDRSGIYSKAFSAPEAAG